MAILIIHTYISLKRIKANYEKLPESDLNAFKSAAFDHSQANACIRKN